MRSQINKCTYYAGMVWCVYILINSYTSKLLYILVLAQGSESVYILYNFDLYGFCFVPRTLLKSAVYCRYELNYRRLLVMCLFMGSLFSY